MEDPYNEELSGKITLNRLELTEALAESKSRSEKIVLYRRAWTACFWRSSCRPRQIHRESSFLVKT